VISYYINVGQKLEQNTLKIVIFEIKKKRYSILIVSYVFKIPLAVSTKRLQIAGATRIAYATPLILFILPGSVKFIGMSFGLVGHLKSTSPPPLGFAPRLTIFNSRPSSEPINRLNIGIVEYLMQSILNI
jgi:hypothetical protein